MSARRAGALIATAVPLALAGCLALAPVGAAALKIRVAKPAPTVKIPTSNAVGNYFDDSQRASTTCRGRERALAPGIADAPRHLVGQSFGPQAVSAWATGAEGRVKLRLQLLCARGASISHRRKPGRTRPVGSTRLTSTATVGCGRKRIAIGAPLSQEFSPGFGRFASKPRGASGWQVTVEAIPSTFPFQTTAPAYADVACVPKRSLKAVKVVERSTKALASASSAELQVPCRGGRRAVGWGVEQLPFTASTYGRAADGWALPIVRKAAFSGNGMAFRFDLPPGARVSASDVTQTVYVICAKPA